MLEESISTVKDTLPWEGNNTNTVEENAPPRIKMRL
jgi:hypothetical protein